MGAQGVRFSFRPIMESTVEISHGENYFSIVISRDLFKFFKMFISLLRTPSVMGGIIINNYQVDRCVGLKSGLDNSPCVLYEIFTRLKKQFGHVDGCGRIPF